MFTTMHTFTKRLPFLATLLLALCLTACDDDNDNEYYTGNNNGALSVVRSDLSFPAKGATGDIVVRTSDGFTATSNKDWCQLTVEGTTVHVTAERNTSLEGRNAIVTLEGSGTTLRLPVKQDGAVWMVRGATSYSASDEDTIVVIPATLDFDYTVTKPDWMDGEEVEDGYQLHLHTNDTGGAREGNVTFKSSQGSKTIKFRQFGKRSVGGKYDITYNYTHTVTVGVGLLTETVTQTETVTKRIEVVADNAQSYLYLKGLNDDYDIPFFMGSDGTLSIANGHRLDNVKAEHKYVYVVLHQDSEYQNFIFAGDCTYDAPLKLTSKSGILMPSFTFAKKSVTFLDPTGNDATIVANGFMLKTASMPDIRYTQAGEELGQYNNVKLTKVLE